VFGISMVAAGFITDKYKLNRVYVVAIGSGLTGVALVIEVSHSISLSCLHFTRPAMTQNFYASGHTHAWPYTPYDQRCLHDTGNRNRAEDDLLSILQACASSFTMFLAGTVLNALTSSVVQNIPFAILSDILPPEQFG
jgi:MFS family permease